MMTHPGLRLITSFCMSFLFCLLLLAHVPVSLAQQLKAAEVSALVNDLKDENAKVRFEAATRLLSAGAEARASVSVLLELVKRDDEVGLQVLDLFGNIGPEAREAIPVLAEALNDDARHLRYLALKALGSIGRDKLNVAELARELKDKDPQVRAVAFGRLAAMRNDAQAAAPTLIEMLKDEDKRTRRVAVHVLGETHAKAPLPTLVALLKDEDKDTRAGAMIVLSYIGPEARDAVPMLAEALNDDAYYVRYAALKALGSIGRDKLNVAELARELKDKDPQVRAVAFGRVAAMSDDAQAAAPTLIEMLKDKDKRTRRVAVYVLGKTRAKVPLPILVALLKDEDKDTRADVMVQLSYIGPEARDAVPALIDILRGDDNYLRGHAASALGGIGPDAKPAASILLKMLRDPDAHMRSSAAYALRKVELDASTVPVIIEALRDEHFMVRTYALEMLQKLGPAARDATSLLTGMLTAPVFMSRFEAANTLRAIGPGAKDAVPALLKSLNDRHPYVRAMAAIALLKIAPENESQITPDVLSHAKDWIERVEKKGGRYVIGFMPAPKPKSAEAASEVRRGDEFYERKDFDAALASFTKAVEIDPSYAEAYYGRGLVRRARGENNAALADFTEAIITASESPEMYYHARGLTQLARGEFDAAIADFTEVIRLNGYNADAYFARGLARERKGNHDTAIADYDRALGFIPPVTEAYGPRGMAKLALGKVVDALADFNEAVKVDPQNYANYEGVGDAYARLGDTERARDAWGKALSLSSEAEISARLKGKLSGAVKP